MFSFKKRSSGALAMFASEQTVSRSSFVVESPRNVGLARIRWTHFRTTSEVTNCCSVTMFGATGPWPAMTSGVVARTWEVD